MSAGDVAGEHMDHKMTSGHFDSAACRIIEERVATLIKTDRQSVAHGMDHLQRVAQNARKLLVSYPQANAEIVYLAVLLHDVEQPFDDKKGHVARSLAVAKRLLAEIDYPQAAAMRVLEVIGQHSTEHVAQTPPTSIEAKILFDADKLDGLGPHGILRVFMLSHQMGRPLGESIAWYRAKIAIAEANFQTPEGRALMKLRLPLVNDFLAALVEDCRETPIAFL